MRMLKVGLSALALVTVAATAGCNPYGSYCEAAMDCMGGNDADIEACEIQAEAQEDIASIHECDDEWDAYFTCVEEEASCEEVGPIDVYTTTGDDCVDEAEDLDDCVD